MTRARAEHRVQMKRALRRLGINLPIDTNDETLASICKAAGAQLDERDTLKYQTGLKLAQSLVVDYSDLGKTPEQIAAMAPGEMVNAQPSVWR